ncbi:MAG TPA: 3-oxoacyl-ACP reductase FabG [Myxococcales bacterium]|nr:3-oxoacyl-ACP reductase FabG [Myxococcales bacterium]HIL81803.1 3-oxoacyl-ACP reductase FabG [Myxococcales bacterium]
MAERVLVTGGSRGIGRAIALKLASDGFATVINFRSRCDEAEQVQASIHAAGGEATLLPFDVGDRATAAATLNEDIATNGPYYGVVCNAGVHSDSAFPAMSPDVWDHVLRTNLDGFYNVLHPIVMPMVRAKAGGRIVTISSASGTMGNRGQVNYSASKAGLVGATRSLALELAKRRITVNSVAPGLIDTEMTETVPKEAITRLIPMKRMGTPEEVASVVSFLFSQGSSYVTGELIAVNGGLG